MNKRSGTEAILRSSDWLVHSELGNFARSLVSGLNDVAAPLNPFMSSQDFLQDDFITRWPILSIKWPFTHLIITECV